MTIYKISPPVTPPDLTNPADKPDDAKAKGAADGEAADEGGGGGQAPELPSKFKTVAELAKAYAESERKITELTKPAAAKKDGETPPAQAAPVLTDDELAAYQEEFTSKGDLSPETRAKIEAKIPKALVDRYLDGIRAKAEQVEARAMAIVGGAETFKAMREWAAENLDPKTDGAAFNDAMRSGNENLIHLALRGLHAQYTEATGSPSQRPARRLSGDTSAPTGLKPFRSNDEMRAAMRNPLYRTDPAYRQKIKDRLAISPGI